MPELTVSPLSVVNQIKSNLQDRYDSGYPILKELLQNADDAGAHRFRLDARCGWPDARNPLLRGPGLLVVNDGAFRPKEDRRGILSFGESVKAADKATIGKFGLGQKAVFHLCDAFVVHPLDRDRDKNKPFVVNPFLGVEAQENVAREWDDLSDDDAKRLNAAVSDDFHARGIVLWLPFRSEHLRPAPGLSFSTNRPSISGTVDELARTEDLQILLTVLRHLQSIEIRAQARRDSTPVTRCVVRVRDKTKRLCGPQELRVGTQPFGGAIHYKDANEPAPFVGREATNPSDRLKILQRSDHWPTANSVFDAQPKPEKGEPHGAATLLRTTNDIGIRPNELTISWAVFLPISDQENTALPIRHYAAPGRSGDTSDVGRLRLLLHGYFFIDSGRRRIDGLTRSAPPDAPSSDTELHRAWNVELRDSVVLPLIPAVLKDALDSKMVTPVELAALTAAIAQDDWFKDNRRNICRHEALVRVLDAPAVVTWRLVPAGTAIRPLPQSVNNHPERVQELFGEVHPWAGERGIVLCVDTSASLTAEPMHWTAEELGSLFSGLTRRIFSSRALASLLADFLRLTVSGDDHRRATAPHVVRAFRAALCDTVPLASSEHLTGILEHLPHAPLFPLPKGVEHRQVLRALASRDAATLPVRRAWVPDYNTRRSEIPRADLETFLKTLEPLIENRDADSPTNTDLAAQAATAALALLDHADGGMSALANDARFAGIEVVRGRDPRNGRVLALSIKDLVGHSQEGLLFGPSPQANELLALLVGAAPDAKPVIVEGRTAEYLKRPSEGGHSAPQPLEAGKDTVLAIINRTSRFGDESDRAMLLDGLKPAAGDDRQALRRLCAGNHDAGAATAKLRVLDHTWNGIERIIKEVLGRRGDCFLVPSSIAEGLSAKLRNYLDIDVLDAPGIEALLEGDLDTISRLRPTESEREAFLLIDLSDSLLQRLPIHARADGPVGDTDEVYREVDWPIPAALMKEVVTVQSCRNPEARKRQEKLIRRWSPTTQIETALRRKEPHVVWKEILDAVTKLPAPSGEDDSALVAQLRKIRWLVADGMPVSPDDVLALAPGVDEQARALLTTDEERPAFVPMDALNIDIRHHVGFEYVKRHLLPDADASLDALAEMIDDAGLVGSLGAEDDRLFNDLATLARNGANLALPGWPLLAAVLASSESDRKPVRDIVSSFSSVDRQKHEIAACHLDALAELARAPDTPEGQAARRVYVHGFTTIAGWPDDARRKVLGSTRVPTVAGVWRTGRAVVKEANGIARTHALEPRLVSMLRQHSRSHVEDTAAVSNGPSDGSSDPGRIVQNHDGFIDVDLPELERESAAELREFLEPWKGHVPEDLVITYLGLIGRYQCVREVAEEWRPGASADVDTLWDTLDQRMKPTRGGTGGPNPLRKEIDGRRFRIRVNAGKCVSAIALSGDRFEAPLDEGTSGLVVGNVHTQPQRVRSTDGSQRKLLIEIQLRQVDHRERRSTEEAPAMFRRLVETVAVDCHHLFMSDAQDALKKILDKVTDVDQSTLEDTKLLLRDRLPGILAEMKLPSGSACREALQEYQEKEGRLLRFSPSDEAKRRDDLKARLWERIDDADAVAELLSSIRDRIEDLGYSADRVLFELLQNADDAYAQLDDVPHRASFRVEDLGNHTGIRVAHWGRRINHPGANTDDGYGLGRDRDLLNMLVMNFSEKPAEGDLTGKFGLGFKSVHILSDSVGIASGFLTLRTRGGFLPEPWPEGIGEAEKLSPDGRRTTVIDVPFATDRVDACARSLQAFRTAATWLPAFARCIRRIEITGVDPVTVDCTVSRLPGSSTIDVITIRRSARKQLALRFKIGDGHSLLLAIDSSGPCAFPKEIKRLWNLAPLEEEVRSGWLLNGPFAVDPGRGRLAGSIDARQRRFRQLGQVFGQRMLELYDLTDADWTGIAKALELSEASEHDARPRFWKRLFDVVNRDFDDDLAQFLHARDRGYGRVAAQKPVTPTGLPAPFDGLARTSDVKRFTKGALTDPTVLEQVRRWPPLVELSGRIVAREVAERLKKLGFGGIQPITLSDLLRHEMSEDGRIDAEAGTRLGRVVTSAAIEKGPLHSERNTILDVVRQAKFRAQDDAWRHIRDLNTKSGGDDEKLICGFAPESALLHPDYHGTSLEFFKVARSWSGYGPKATDLGKWARNVNSPDRRRAVLRYIISGRQGGELAKVLHGDLPAWIPRPLARLLSDHLLTGWSEEDKKRLLIELGGGKLVDVRPYDPNEIKEGTQSDDPVYGQRYREIRAAIMAGEPMCRFCGSRRATETHHWRYPDSPENLAPEDLTPVCKGCHEIVERFKKFDRTGRPQQDFLAVIDNFLATITSRPLSPKLGSKAKEILVRIHNWWATENTAERGEHAKRIYPESFSPAQLRKTDDRVSWFTMFALACFQSLGRTQDQQHRGFIELGLREGWWQELAKSKPPDDYQPWLERLERWAALNRIDQDFLPWKRVFVDLYTIARWLDEYITLFRKFPRIVENQERVSLDVILRPTYAPEATKVGVDAAPINRSLAIGANWLIRELVRYKVYGPGDESLLAPWCWMPTQRVRDLLDRLGARIGAPVDNAASRSIYDFVVKQIGVDHARFGGDLDLPLQIITRSEHRETLERFFDEAGLDTPDFHDAADNLWPGQAP